MQILIDTVFIICTLHNICYFMTYFLGPISTIMSTVL